jgi:hypothetical protein
MEGLQAALPDPQAAPPHLDQALPPMPICFLVEDAKPGLALRLAQMEVLRLAPYVPQVERLHPERALPPMLISSLVEIAKPVLALLFAQVAPHQIDAAVRSIGISCLSAADSLPEKGERLEQALRQSLVDRVLLDC